MSTYEGDYPVPNKWVEEHLDDEQVTFRYVMSLDDLIWVGDMEGMNDFMDSVLSMRNASLTNLSYAFAEAEWDNHDPQNVIIEVTGVLEAF